MFGLLVIAGCGSSEPAPTPAPEVKIETPAAKPGEPAPGLLSNPYNDSGESSAKKSRSR